MFPLDLSAFNDAILAPFSESVTYRPRGGGTRSITANVQREMIEGLDGVDQGTVSAFTIHVRNNVTTGIAGSEIDTGGDAIDVADHSGGTPVMRYIKRVLDSDPGMLVLLVR